MLIYAFKVLDKVYREGAYVGIALNEVEIPRESRPAVTQLVYGTLERSAALDYYIDKLCPKRPKPVICVILRMGLYQLLYGNAPEYAATSGTVNLAKEAGKGAQAGFVNAVLKRYSSVPVPTGDDEKLMFYTGKPLWYLRAVRADYPEIYRELLHAQPSRLTHIRGRNIDFNTPYGAYRTAAELAKIDKRSYVIQSLGSCVISSAVGAEAGDCILDACAAPGGKAVHIAGLANCRVTACDIHPHRVELIKKYATSVSAANVAAVVADAVEFKSEWAERFDRVLADVPCSGSGVVWSKPDILLREPNLQSLNLLQSSILDNVAGYVKPGGRLVYSTCSLFAGENDGVIEVFLRAHPEFRTVEELPKVGYKRTKYGVQLLPDRSDTEGFYYTVMRKSQ